MSATSLQSGEGDFLKRAYSLQNPAEARDLYNEWASSYDQDLEADEYTFPAKAAAALVAATGNAVGHTKVFDAGAGTGMVGKLLANHGVKLIDGGDISPGMLELARKTGAYQNLQEIDLTQPIPLEDQSYDAVTCVGTLTKGHVGPVVLDEFVRIVRHNGYIIATVLDSIWETAGFSTKIDELLRQKSIQIAKNEVTGISGDAKTGGRLLVLQRL